MKNQNKIESLTPAQERALIEYRAEWLAIGRSTAPADRPTAEKAITEMYRLIKQKAPQFWWCDGPATGSMMRVLLRKDKKFFANLFANLFDNLSDNLSANLRDNLSANLSANLFDNLFANLNDNLSANLEWDFWGAASWETAWAAYYDFPDSHLRKMHTKGQRKTLSLWMDISKSCGWWKAHQSVVFICERPQVQSLDSAGRLHADLAPAMLCRDGWPVYALHGIRMKPEYVLTPAEKLNPVDILKEPNADVRRELIRKVGVEMMLSSLPHKVLDKRGHYEVLKVDFPGLAQDTRYLKMLNPSIGVWHLEGVERECNTVEQAINWRAGALRVTDWKPEIVT